jgi:hypothetical protein
MIAEAVKFLRDRLNQALGPDASEAAAEELFVYAKTDKDDVAGFKPGAVSVLLIGMEEEKTLRPPDLYSSAVDGKRQRVEPEIRMNLHLLFVARFPDDYGRALQQLSRLIRYFQNHRVFNHDNSPELDPGIAQLVLELATPSFSEQNEIWGVLRAAYQPSALYKIKMILFRDGSAQELTQVKELHQKVIQVHP